MAKLAINGGSKVRTKKFPPYISIGQEELNRVKQVFDSNIFSRFLGCWHDDFFGGPQIQALEKAWAEHFKVKHAIAVNSATSALYCAVGAIGTEPYEEIIVSPYTMSAGAIAPLVYNAIPVFADIEPDCFCLDINSIESKITSRTRAIIVTDIFGQVYDQRINALAKKHGLYLIEDCAQAPYAKYKDSFAGTLGDIGIYSLNYHKHIHSGEGGILVTNNDILANKLRLIRNHAEAVIEAKGDLDLTNMLGFNYRMTEIEAAIAYEQLFKLEELVEQRINNVRYIENGLLDLPFLSMPKVREDCTHAYYLHPMLYTVDQAGGIHRNIFIEAVKAELMPMELRETEGVKVGYGYVKPLYLLPMFQNRQAYGTKHFPWSGTDVAYNYAQGLCPTCEKLHFDTLVSHEYMRPGMQQEDMDDVIKAFYKVWENKNELRK